MIFAILFFAVSLSAAAQQSPASFAHSFQAAQRDHQDADYQKGLRALDARQWDSAIKDFSACAKRKGSTTDAALYWKAYAQNRAGEREDALDTISDLKDDYPSSRWVKDAKALELEIRTAIGAPVDAGSYGDNDLKLLALNSLMGSDPDKALPILKGLLKSTNPSQMKDLAMFVLAQNPSPEAHKLLVEIARDSSNPDLQLKAISYMGMMGTPSRDTLISVYNSSSDPRVKRAILEGFMLSGARDALFNAAKTEKDPELRRDAINQLAICGGEEQLWQLYHANISTEDKDTILKSIFLTGNSAHIAEIARTERDPDLRIAAITSLGMMGGEGQADILVSIYRSDSNEDVRRAVLNALFLQQNAKALIELARNEKDPEMKKQIVNKLALIHSKDATDYMMELLK